MKRLLKGFTLIELLIVIAIIGILTVALLPQVLQAPAKARDTAKMKVVQDIKAAVEMYISSNAGAYPDMGTVADDGVLGCVGTKVAGKLQLSKTAIVPASGCTYYYHSTTISATDLTKAYYIGFEPEIAANNNSIAVPATFGAASKYQAQFAKDSTTPANNKMYVITN